MCYAINRNLLYYAHYDHLQLSIEAFDGGNPSRKTYSSLILNVDRNLETPIITGPGAAQLFQATANIIETITFDTLVFDVTASDNGNTVSLWDSCVAGYGTSFMTIIDILVVTFSL